MPGGYDGYLISVRRVLDLVEEQRPTDTELSELLAQEFSVSDRRSYALAVFLRRTGFLEGTGGAVEIGEWAARWRVSSDPRIPIALLHSRVRFIGELLKFTTTPRSMAEVLALANERYGCGWSTQAQVSRRRGWLQSAGMLQMDASDQLVTTEQGQELLVRLTLFEPERLPPPKAQHRVDRATAPLSPAPPARLVSGPEELVAELVASSTNSADPDRFERAVRDAFAFLGFEASWLGGAGRTDVLVDAPLGRDEQYRVIVDCKTSGSGAVTDQQIDWMTLTEHRQKHDAQYVAVVAPRPSGSRLLARAAQQGVAVISVEQLVGLCQQHAQAPLGLQSYRRLFTTGGLSMAEPVAEDAEEWLRIVHLASAVCAALRSKSAAFGPLSARDLLLILADAPVAEATSEGELQTILDTLASPLVGVLMRTNEGAYWLTAMPEVMAARLEILAAALASTRGDLGQQRVEAVG
jgi:Restriction endonuclease